MRLLMLPDLHLPARPQATQRILDSRAFLDTRNYVVLLGDMVRAYATPREYAAAREFVSALNRPYTAVNGNHEFWFAPVLEDDPNYSQTWEQGSDEQQRAALSAFKKFYGLQSLWRVQRNALGTFIFLGLDGVGVHKQETLSQEQQAFLLAQLQEAGRAPVYVFCHAPLMLNKRLDMVYYEEARTGCVELTGELGRVMSERRGPTFWMSGHIHLHPEHYLFAPYECGPNVWQVHCPDGWGYSRWTREQHVPNQHDGVFTRSLEASSHAAVFVAWDHVANREASRHQINF